ncbi:hypothetical protein F5884DRAFT_732738 [Xylogone sp. PMI_703]|nr:hypothetical protein F5884DRAFT_732738 [Xylogone sp. PMI_703]
MASEPEDTSHTKQQTSDDEPSAQLSELTINDDAPKEIIDEPTKLVHKFLLKEEPEFVRAKEFRDRGWYQNKEQGDEYFKKQREMSDATTQKQFFVMMRQIAEEMHVAVSIFDISIYPDTELKILDLCMAPGGYSAAALNHHRKAKVFGITLPESQGGHEVVLDKSKLAGLQKIDITMLAAEFFNKPVPPNHPERSSFSMLRPFRHHSFHLIFCDGIILRTHERAIRRRVTEAFRLRFSQLILALHRISEGGTLVMLLHKVDQWSSMLILYQFSQFSNIELFKPVRKHGARSSFYMVAKNIDPKHPAAKEALESWKEGWWTSTFGGEDGLGTVIEYPEAFVGEVIEKFGKRLALLGRPIWRIQADALSKTDYAGTTDAPTPPTQDQLSSS